MLYLRGIYEASMKHPFKNFLSLRPEFIHQGFFPLIQFLANLKLSIFIPACSALDRIVKYANKTDIPDSNFLFFRL